MAGRLKAWDGSAWQYVEGALQPPSEQTFSSTGAQANVALNNWIWVNVRCTGAAPVISGFVPGYDGQTISLYCLGTSLRVLHQDSGSSAANQIICPSTNGLIVGLGGRIDGFYDATSQKWRMFTVSAGSPITPSFDAGDYTAQAGNWNVDAGDVTTLTYTQINKRLHVDIGLDTTSVTATPTTLRRVIPGGFSCSKSTLNPMIGTEGAVDLAGWIIVNSSTPTTMVFALIGTTWMTTTDDTYVYGQIDLEVD